MRIFVKSFNPTINLKILPVNKTCDKINPARQ